MTKRFIACKDVSFDACCQHFSESVAISALPAMREAERAVLGCDYGGTSWTTCRQVEQIAKTLHLNRSIALLEIGAGSGWPGLLLAKRSGCHVTLTDLPENGLRMARDRARDEGIDKRVTVVSGSGFALPFNSEHFDAISHSDVLCCLPEKLETLRECRRVAKNGARMHFSVIAATHGLSSADRARVIESGPPFVDAPSDYGDLLTQGGWEIVRREDVTPEYRQCLCTLIRAFDENAALREALGEDFTCEAGQHRSEQVALIDAGLLLRETFLAAAS